MAEIENWFNRTLEYFDEKPTPPYIRTPFQTEQGKPISGRIEIYTGHGLQRVGMGKDLFEKYNVARQMYGIATEEAKWDVAEMSFEGPAQLLNMTEHAQITNGTLSAIYKRVMTFQRPNTHGRYPRVVAGQSLGEYNAAYEAGCWGDPNTKEAFRKFSRVLVERGKIMQKVSDRVDGKLVVVMWDGKKKGSIRGTDAVSIATENGTNKHGLSVAIDVSAQQVILGGKRVNVERFLQEEIPSLEEYGVVGRISEASSGPFHTDEMVDAVDPIRALLKESNMEDPRSLIVANTEKRFLTTAEDVESELGNLTTQTVRGRDMNQLVKENCRGVIYFIGGRRTIAADMFEGSIEGERKPFVIGRKIFLTAGVGAGISAGIILGSRAIVNRKRSGKDGEE